MKFCFNPNPEQCPYSFDGYLHTEPGISYPMVQCEDIGQWKKCKWTKKYIIWKLIT